jgi:glycosyltransferase involved in cell wall biosynthesis
MKKPLVSVIIPTFNRAQKVVKAISSVLDQTFKDSEIIVVDDGSEDETHLAVSKFKNLVKYKAHTSNLGVSAARNSGIRLSRAPFVSFLDSDDYWLPKKLYEQVDYFEKHPQAKICQTEEIWIRNGKRVNPKNKHKKPSGDIFIPSLKLCLVSPSAVMLKRSLLDDVGVFDESLPACEDYDLWLRIACRYPIYLIKKSLVVKVGGSDDQLSSKYKGMDKFRIKALEKLIKSDYLNEVQLQAVMEELSRKCSIFGNGCLKRGKNEEGRYYLSLPKKLKRSTGLVY